MDEHAHKQTEDRKRTVIIGVMLSGAFIAVLNQTILSPALPSIMRDMGITAVEGQWLTTAFMLVNGIMIPITAYFIDRFTTRQLFLSSMILFTAGTAIAGVAPTFWVLLVARILQAMAAGILMPMIQTVILLLFPREKRGSAMGTVGIVIAFAPAIGPTLAGWAVDSWGWNSIFLVIAPLAAVDVVLGFFLLENVGEITKRKLDICSVIYSTLGFGGLLYGFSAAGSYGWIHALTLVPLAVGAVFLMIFIRRQLCLDMPLLELHVLRNRVFTYATIIGMIVNAALIAGTIIMPIYMQNVLRFTAMQSGLVMLPGAIVMGIMSPVTGNLFDRFGPRGIALIGLSIMTAFSGFFVVMDETWSFGFLCMIYTVRMFGLSLVNMPLTTWGLNALENRMIAHGSAINNTVRQVAGSIGTAILITIMAIITAWNKEAGTLEATLSGMHAAFGVAAGLSAVALVMAVLFVKKEKQTDDIFCD
ncbi:MAG: multidrug efflux MFS transporter [Firmicutes bacterium]|nr:multidrug efflux MFS transporter [Bacillota bacterium]NBI63659.1 DHA2 family efflux MFS transporter permease subunit [Clostridiales bacterium]